MRSGPSSTPAGNVKIVSTPQDHRIAYLTALAIAIHVAEAVLPSPVPGIKPGLANIVTIVVLIQFGWATAAWVGLLRALAGSLIIGTFLAPTFFMSFGGALAAVTALRLATLLPGLGPVGYSLVASMAHMAAQFTIAYTLFVPHPAMLHLLPIFMTAAVGFGLLNGLIAQGVVRRLGPESAPLTEAGAS